MSRMRPLLLVVVVTASLYSTSASAQSGRSAMVDSARLLIDDFNERQSIDLLRRALSPTLGSPDASWARGVQLLGQTLLQTNERTEAESWLRWALRLSPSLQVDSVNFTPALVAALNEARTTVEASATDSRVSVRFEWTTATKSEGFGDLHIARGESDAANLVQLAVNGELLDEGRPRRLSPGSYRIAARAEGQPDAEITTEVLPGVTTYVTVNFVSARSEMTQATRRLVMSRLARVNDAQLPQSGCRVGFVAGQGLLIARNSALRRDGRQVLQFADGRAASEGISIAPSDLRSDLAVLPLVAATEDSMPLATAVQSGARLWAAHFPTCGDSLSLAPVLVASVTSDSILLAQDAPGFEQWGVLVDSTGSAAGLLAGPRVARRLGSATALLASARANVSDRLLAERGVVPPVVDRVGTGPAGGTTNPRKRRSMKLPIIGGVIAGGIVAALAIPKGGGPTATTGGILVRLP